MKTLFTLTALLEAVTGLSLIAAPSDVASALLGAPLEAPAAQAVARIAGAALLSLGVACWIARHDAGHAARGLLAGMLLYNAGVVAVLVHAATAHGLRGLGLWPAAALHTALGAWCLACLAARPPGSVVSEKETALRT
jgi:hypothetical protein